MSHNNTNTQVENPSTVPFRTAFWLVLTLVGIYLGAVNFVAAFSKEGEKEGDKQKAEMTTPASENKALESKATETPKAEEPKKEEAVAAPKEEPKKEEIKKEPKKKKKHVEDDGINQE